MRGHIPDDDLKLTDLPPQDASWGVIEEFALTFDGYGRWNDFDQCANIATAASFLTR